MTEPKQERRADDDLKKHIDARFDETHDLLKSAFPGGDLDGHRRAHETEIKQSIEKERFWADIRSKLATGIIWGAFLMLGTAAWEYLKKEVQK